MEYDLAKESGVSLSLDSERFVTSEGGAVNAMGTLRTRKALCACLAAVGSSAAFGFCSSVQHVSATVSVLTV